MDIYIGTSGFSYREWLGRFYPAGLKSADYLSYYASRFNAVELNNSFYRIPSVEAMESWRDTVGPDFRFAVKANQAITHRKDFGIPEGQFELFLERVETLGTRLGPVLFQFPPNFGKAERALEFIAHLRSMLERHPMVKPVIELRNKNLLTPEFFRILRDNRLALCLNDAHLAPEDWPAPSDLVYLRLRNGPYERDFLNKVARRIQNWAEQGRECYVFFKHEVIAPELAGEMKDLLGRQPLTV